MAIDGDEDPKSLVARGAGKLNVLSALGSQLPPSTSGEQLRVLHCYII